jgi:hypothetical protein
MKSKAELPTPRLETPDESTSAAREAGLVAARELNDAPGYNRWAAGTLTGSGLGAFRGRYAAAHRLALRDGCCVAAACLARPVAAPFFGLTWCRAGPTAAALYELAAVDVPLPRNSDLVAIETSDLQSDNARGLFVFTGKLA